MNRRAFLGTAAAALVGATAGCTASGADAPGTPTPLDRTVVDETWKAGATEPKCEDAGEKHYSIQNRKSQLLAEVPDSAEVEDVEAFVQERSEFPGDVTILAEKPARIGWREREYDVTERYGTEMYYVGYVGEVGGPHSLLVLIYPDRTKLIHFLNKGDCPGLGS